MVRSKRLAAICIEFLHPWHFTVFSNEVLEFLSNSSSWNLETGSARTIKGLYTLKWKMWGLNGQWFHMLKNQMKIKRAKRKKIPQVFSELPGLPSIFDWIGTRGIKFLLYFNLSISKYGTIFSKNGLSLVDSKQDTSSVGCQRNRDNKKWIAVLFCRNS